MINSGGKKILIHNLFTAENVLARICVSDALRSRRDWIQREILLNGWIDHHCEGRSGIWIVDISTTRCRGWHYKEVRDSFSLPDAFVVEKEECPVGNDGTADSAAKALASVEKAEKYQWIKQIVATVLTFGAAIWLTERSPSPELKLEATILIGVGLIAAVCITKIMTLINRNTKSVLQAIADLKQR